ncbi:hypothetical protein CBS101457_003164 [Exobasidium rhododendri]|nr:hypothetical protein CBS101457_003164 [Exobasidium rhododendri]
MRFFCFAAFVTLALGVSAAPQQVQTRASKSEIPHTGSDLPGVVHLDPSWSKQMFGPDSITEKQIKFFPKPESTGDDCSTTVIFDNSRCTGSAARYFPYVQAFNQQSKNNFVVTRDSKSSDGDYYDKYRIDISHRWQGRIFNTDSPEDYAVNRTGLRGFRLFVSEKQSCVWLEKQPDEESGQTRDVIAPITYV